MPTQEEIFGEYKAESDIDLGLLQMQILWILSRKNSHGYELMKDLSMIKRSKITQGTLYPTMQKLEELKLIKGEEKDNRIVYSLTAKGRKVMNDSCVEFTRTFFGVFQDFVCEKCVSK
jgi:DNA-binding PadR family transcriptional regulator